MLAVLIRRASCLALLVVLSLTSLAHAREHESLASETRAAMEAYEQHDIRKAKGILRKALRRAKRKHVEGKELADLYANIGIVTAAGANSLNRAVRAFRRALKEDPSVKPDRKYASPEAMAAFQAAIRANESGHADLGEDDEEEEDDEEQPAVTRGRREVELKDPDELEEERRASAPPAQKPALPPFQEVVKEPAPGPRAKPASGCVQDSDCGWGATCRDGACSVVSNTPSKGAEGEAGEANEAEAEQPAERKSVRRGFYGALGFGAGVTSLTKGRAPDRLPEQVYVQGAVNRATNPDTLVVDEAEVGRNLVAGGWDCDVDLSDESAPRANNCAVAADPVLVAEPILDVALGYYLTPRLGLALTSLLQIRRGVGPMAGVVIGARLEYLVSTPAEEGLQVSLVAGAGTGAIHVLPQDSPQGGPRATNTALGKIGYAATAGLKALYRTDPHWAFGVTPLVHVGLPNVLVLVALTAGVEANF